MRPCMTVKRRLAQAILTILPVLLRSVLGGGFAGSPDVVASGLGPRSVYGLYASYGVEC